MRTERGRIGTTLRRLEVLVAAVDANGFRAAAERLGLSEAAISRLYGGIHYRMAIEAGIGQGRGVGELVVRRVKTRRPPVVAASGAATAGFVTR